MLCKFLQLESLFYCFGDTKNKNPDKTIFMTHNWLADKTKQRCSDKPYKLGKFTILYSRRQ